MRLFSLRGFFDSVSTIGPGSPGPGVAADRRNVPDVPSPARPSRSPTAVRPQAPIRDDAWASNPIVTARQQLFRLASHPCPPRPAVAPLANPTAAAIRERFVASAGAAMAHVNAGPRTRDRGVWYADDYADAFHRPLNALIGLTNPTIFDMGCGWDFRARAGRPASTAIHAFLSGLTIAECASTLQACLYKGIHDALGTAAFDARFGRSTAPLTLTRILYQGDFKSLRGNPLDSLFKAVAVDPDDIQGSLARLEPGDICGIQGVPNYLMKHPAGRGQAFNVLCVGVNTAGEKLFTGFSPTVFKDGPRTHAEIVAALVELYDAPPTSHDRAQLEACARSADELEQLRAEVGAGLAHHTGGSAGRISCARRLDYEAIARLARREDPLDWSEVSPRRLPASARQVKAADLEAAWAAARGAKDPLLAAALARRFPRAVSRTPDGGGLHVERLSSTEALDLLGALRLRASQPDIPTENIGATLSNYRAETADARALKSLAERMVEHLVDPERRTPLGLLLSGSPGVGKTHLALAVAGRAAAHGLSVGFVNDDAVRLAHNRQAGANGGGKPPGFAESFSNGCDLVIIDDVKSQYGSNAAVANAAIERAAREGKAVMMTSNSGAEAALSTIATTAATSVTEDPMSFVVVRDHIAGESRRPAWWSEPPASTSPEDGLHAAALERLREKGAVPGHIEKLRRLIAYGGARGAGIVLEGKGASADALHASLSAASVGRVRIIPDPSLNKLLDDLGPDDVFILPMNSQSYGCKDLLSKVAAYAHDAGKKLIVLHEESAETMFRSWRSSLLFLEDAPRLSARMGALFAEFPR